MFEKQVARALGEDNGNSKLTVEKVKAIKRSKGKITQRELAEIYGVTRTTIARIHCGLTWEHVKAN